MQKILIATKNPHKQKKLTEIVSPYFIPQKADKLKEVEEAGNTFLKIAENKAIEYSKLYKGFAVSTDGGAIIPALGNQWDPLRTKRFGATDKERIEKVLEMMKGKQDRTVEWYECIAVANNGKLIFSAEARAMNGIIDKEFNPKYYKKGIWLCSITSFPRFDGKNFFELSDKERKATEDSWDKLKEKFREFMTNTARR